MRGQRGGTLCLLWAKADQGHHAGGTQILALEVYVSRRMGHAPWGLAQSHGNDQTRRRSKA